MSAVLEDTFKVTAVDPDGKVFDRVSRIKATSENYGMELTVDINCELFPLQKGQKVSLMISKSLELDGTSSTSSTAAATSYRPSAGPSLADKFEYVMFGRVYKLEEVSSDKMYQNKQPEGSGLSF